MLGLLRAGVRVKLLEAYAGGVPVVSTDGETCLMGDEPQAFADMVLQLLEDPGGATGGEL